MIGNFINYIKSKTLTDIVYIVMMILIVTLIKDMITSIARKRNDKKWLENAFKKSSDDGDVVEGFNIDPCPSDTPDDNAPVCDKLKFLLCNVNFGKFKNLLANLSVDDNDKIDIFCGVINTDTVNVNTITKYDISTNDGHIVINNKLRLNKSLYVIEDLRVDRNFQVIQSSTFEGNMNVNEDLSVSGDLSVSKKTKLQGSVEFHKEREDVRIAYCDGTNKQWKKVAFTSGNMGARTEGVDCS
jgi:hypothetical protein